MTLRSKLLLGYGYLVVLLLVATGSALLGFLTLSEGIDVVLEENFRSIRASMLMLDALERQDSATLGALLGDEAQRGEMATWRETFDGGLASAADNVTEEGEAEILARIRSHEEAYTRARDGLVEESPERPMARYRESVEPRFLDLKRDVLALLEVNQDAMIRADRTARERAVRGGTWLGFIVALTLVSFVLLSRVLQRQVLEPLAELRSGMAVIAEGDLRRRLKSDGRDELALIAGHVNRLLDRLQEVEADLKGKIGAHRRLVLAQLDRMGADSALFGTQGERLAGELPGGRRIENAVVAWIRSRADDEEGRDAATIELPDAAPLAAELLRHRDRPLAWWVRPAE